MHRLLEEYLSQVATELKQIPAEQREEDLREMRQHLLNAITVNQEMMGLDEETATINALEGFGAPKELATEILGAWKRGEQKEYTGSIIPVTLCALASFFIGTLPGLFILTPRVPRNSWMDNGLFALAPALLSAMISYAFMGVITGALFQRQAMPGIRITLATSFIIVAFVQLIGGNPIWVAVLLLPIFGIYIAAMVHWTKWWVRIGIRWRTKIQTMWRGNGGIARG